jgi:hypothetical protein
MLRAAEARMSPRRSAMCLLCRAVDKADRISLFTIRKAGAAGRNGDTIGTYICAGLDCSAAREHPSGGPHHGRRPQEHRRAGPGHARTAGRAHRLDALRLGQPPGRLV